MSLLRAGESGRRGFRLSEPAKNESQLVVRGCVAILRRYRAAEIVHSAGQIASIELPRTDGRPDERFVLQVCAVSQALPFRQLRARAGLVTRETQHARERHGTRREDPVAARWRAGVIPRPSSSPSDP